MKASKMVPSSRIDHNSHTGKVAQNKRHTRDTAVPQWYHINDTSHVNQTDSQISNDCSKRFIHHTFHHLHIVVSPNSDRNCVENSEHRDTSERGKAEDKTMSDDFFSKVERCGTVPEFTKSAVEGLALGGLYGALADGIGAVPGALTMATMMVAAKAIETAATCKNEDNHAVKTLPHVIVHGH
jgi:hypothetical protein